jgi:hypothetical protein
VTLTNGRRRRRHTAIVSALVTLTVLTVACSAAVDGRGTISTPTGAVTTSPAPDAGPSADVQFSSTVGPTTGDVPADPDTTDSPDSHDRWLPSETNPDPTVDIEGVFIGAPALYAQRYHFEAPQRVAYDRYPPVGGPHDPAWAACDGVVYAKPVRNEMMVHALEHGAVWIAYNPDTLPAGELSDLQALVAQVSYLMLSPYPGLGTPLSLQAWAHQLPLDSGADPRLQQFVLALLRNPYLTPEASATCTNAAFDVADPPPFVAEPPGPDGIPLDWTPPAEGDAPTAPTTG